MIIDPYKFAAAAPATYRQTIMSDSPLLYWTMDAGSGPIVDESGGGYNATSENVGGYGSPDAAPRGSDFSVNLFSNNHHVTRSGNPLNGSTSANIGFWFYSGNLVAGQILKVGGNTNGIGVGLNGSAKIIACAASDGITHMDVVSTTTIQLNTLYHVAVRFSYAQTMKLYINGVEEASVGLLGSTSSGAADIVIGSGGSALSANHGSTYNTPAKFRIGHLAIFNSALATSRPLAHYNAGKR